MGTYRLQRQYHAPGNSSNDHRPRHFVENEEVKGARYKPAKSGSPMPMIMTEDGYLIPEIFAVLLDPESEAEMQLPEPEIVEEILADPEPVTISADGNDENQQQEQDDTPTDMQQVTDNFHKELDEIKNTDIIQKAIVKSRNSVNGTLIGAGVGLAVGLVWRKNILIMTVLGGVIGGLVGNAWATDFRKAKDQYLPKPQ